jgi:hypothetical protein
MMNNVTWKDLDLKLKPGHHMFESEGCSYNNGI